MDVMVGNYDALCEGLSGLTPAIIVAAVLSKGTAVASRLKPGIFILEGKALEHILLQLELLVGMPKTNEKLCGEVGYVIVNYGSADHLLFPVNDGHNMMVSVVVPYKQGLIGQIKCTIARTIGIGQNQS
jgi:hypothetical protein